MNFKYKFSHTNIKILQLILVKSDDSTASFCSCHDNHATMQLFIDNVIILQ